jgi:nucleoside-diphosphate-sugar epimerase
MKILVTGATGFLGKKLVRSLCAEGHLCRCLVRSTSNLSSFNDLKSLEIISNETQEVIRNSIAKRYEEWAEGIEAGLQSKAEQYTKGKMLFRSKQLQRHLASIRLEESRKWSEVLQ